MSNSLDEILDALWNTAWNKAKTPGAAGLKISDARQQILQWVADEVVGESELHVSHVCPPDNVGCAKFAQRGTTRNHQRQILKAHGWKEPS